MTSGRIYFKDVKGELQKLATDDILYFTDGTDATKKYVENVAKVKVNSPVLGVIDKEK